LSRFHSILDIKIGDEPQKDYTNEPKKVFHNRKYGTIQQPCQGLRCGSKIVCCSLNTKMDYGHWDITAVGDFDPAEYFGFIYIIEQLSTGKAYVGKKQFTFKRKKTKSNKSRTKDSDWRDYTSSSESVCDLIAEVGKVDFAFRIVLLCVGRCMLGYEEESMQRTLDVLRCRLPNGDRKYFNRTIGYKNFAGLEKQTELTKEKHRQNMLGRVVSEETKRKMSEAKLGVPKTPEHIEANRLAHTGRTYTRRKVDYAVWNKGLTKTPSVC
jgi:hypothetical protein